MKIHNLTTDNASIQTRQEFMTDVLIGLSSTPKKISAKYFYDDTGSELFQKISQHKDYYVTKTEFSILEKYGAELASSIHDDEIDIIELGAGDGHKSRLIINSFLDQGTKVNFYPIDISEKAMELMGENLAVNNKLNMNGIVGDYFQGLNFVKGSSSNKKLVLFLGSNIGNFNTIQMTEFLQKLWLNLDSDDHVLIGFDLKKDFEILNLAYNDSDGLTAEFNMNMLERINAELNANFDISKFKHYGFYNPFSGAMESHIISMHAQEIYISALGKNIYFDQYEALHLESSFKFTEQEITELSERTGYQTRTLFTDTNKYFIDALWQVKKN